MNTADDGHIITEVLKGDRNAFEALVRRYHKQVFTLMSRFARSPNEATDLTQEAFMRAYDKLETFQPGKRFFAWLYTLSLNLARDYARRNKKYVESPLEEMDSVDSETTDQESRLIQQGEIRAMSEALNRLPDDFREALILRYKEDFSIKDIAQILDITVSGAKMRIHRGLMKLREVFLEDSHER